MPAIAWSRHTLPCTGPGSVQSGGAARDRSTTGWRDGRGRNHRVRAKPTGDDVRTECPGQPAAWILCGRAGSLTAGVLVPGGGRREPIRRRPGSEPASLPGIIPTPCRAAHLTYRRRSTECQSIPALFVLRFGRHPIRQAGSEGGSRFDDSMTDRANTTGLSQDCSGRQVQGIDDSHCSAAPDGAADQPLGTAAVMHGMRPVGARTAGPFCKHIGRSPGLEIPPIGEDETVPLPTPVHSSTDLSAR